MWLENWVILGGNSEIKKNSREANIWDNRSVCLVLKLSSFFSAVSNSDSITH